MKSCGPERVVIQHIQPQVDGGKYPVKRTVGEIVEVTADIFVDGHDHINANLLWKKEGQEEWNRVVMTMINNDRWSACFTVREIGTYIFSIEAWVDHFETWQEDLKKKYNNGQDVEIEFKIGSSYLEDVIDHAKDRKEIFEWKKKLQEKHSIEKRVTLAEDPSLSLLMRECTRKINPTIYPKELRVVCSRNKALYSTWYEMFPRSFGNSGKHGTFRDCIRELPQIAKMGFDVLYFPPIHPIGHTNRKGKNNALVCEKGSPGCPWAIGSKEGGHDAVHPDLGTLEDFQMLVKEAGHLGISLAIDLAFQCSPDHPYVKKHPKWFKWRPDGTVQYAENPPKKYEDIIPFHFENEDWKALWEELKRVVLYWVDQGIKIFRVDNPHTKPFLFWKWLINEVKAKDPDVLFLSEAFTRPKVMQHLAKMGFDQSYTYFTWRNNKHELMDYITELTKSNLRDYFRPNFWPNTPDILPEALQFGGRQAFIVRLILAATLSSNYGIYGPPFELAVSAALKKEEYLDSEKYEIREWNREQKGNLVDLIALVNQIRRENPPLQTTWNTHFCQINNEHLIAYLKIPADDSLPLLIVVNLDFFHTQAGTLQLPLQMLGIKEDQSFLVHDLLSDEKYQWSGRSNYIALNPATVPAHIFHLHSLEKTL